MRIRSIFILLAIIIGGLLFLVAGALIVNTSRMSEKARMQANELKSISVAREIKVALLSYARDAHLASQTGSEMYYKMQAEERKRVADKLAEARNFVTSEEENRLLGQVASETIRYLQQQDVISREGYLLGHPSNLELVKRLDELMIHLDSFIEIHRNQAASASHSVTEWDAASNIMGRGVIVIVLLIGAATTLFFRNQIYLPLKKLSATIGSYANGATDARANPVGPLEIRQIGAAFNQMAQALNESRQRQLQFLAGVVHDLKTPLTAMKGYTGLLLAKNLKNEELAAPLRVITVQIDRLTVMLQDLLDATSIEAGALELSKADFDIRDTVQRSVDLFSPLSQLHTIRFDRPPGELRVHADEHRLEQVIGNLLSNAIKYSPGGSEIKVRLARKDKQVQLEVSDLGLGVKPSEWNTIFLPFVRSDSNRDKIPGVGLGLSVSRKIVNAHGGTISVESVPGQGSTFSVTLPVEKRQSPAD